MTTDRPGSEPPEGRDDGAIQIHSCSRIGMRANPPGLRLSFGGRRRRD